MSLITRLFRDARGTTLVELAIALPLFLLILFVLIDFGRLGFEYVLAEKAMQIAARTAVVRPAACAGLPEFNVKGATVAEYGTNCQTAAGICADPGAISCNGASSNATANEIWTGIAPLMPPGSTIANLRFSYTFNSDLGFLGGPYVPMVTVSLQNLDFEFLSPIGGLLELAGGVSSDIPDSLAFPSMSVTLPGEDLAQGENG